MCMYIYIYIYIYTYIERAKKKGRGAALRSMNLVSETHSITRHIPVFSCLLYVEIKRSDCYPSIRFFEIVLIDKVPENSRK